MRKILIVVCVSILCLSGGCCFLSSNCVSSSGLDRDFERFISLRKKLSEERNERRIKNIEFAIAEYYFKINDFVDARLAFEDYKKNRLADLHILLANCYLYKIAQTAGQAQITEDLKKEIFNKQFVLLFDRYKSIKYKSLLGSQYEILYFVDKIDVFLNGDVFVQIVP
ncbi:MAG: hypothetical protein WC676_07615 [Candidatus Omnitrophota bacterium]